MQYTDEGYPFPIKTPYVPSSNPTGLYNKNINITKELLNEDIYLKLDGVDCYYELYVNDKYVGLNKGARLTAEFLLNSFVKEGDNSITIKVTQ
jgi:beta-galactosidase/beta-glucuronidase